MPFSQIVLAAFGGPEQLHIRTVETLPEPGPGEVRIRVLVTSVAFTDVMIRKGMYRDVKDRPPFVPGYDFVGLVEAVGEGVTAFAPGDRVADLSTLGAYSEFICRPADDLTAVPDGVSDEDALAVVLSGVTPYQMLHRVARIEAGQSILIHGAGGAVGTAMLQLARDAGVRAFGTDIPEKHALIRQYGGTPIAIAEPDLASATGGGIDVVFDPIGGKSLRRSLRAVKRGGTLVGFGFTSAVLGQGGSIPADFLKVKLWNWLPNGRATTFYSIGAMRRDHPEWFRHDLATLFAMVAEKRFDPAIAETVTMDDVRAAHARVEAGAVPGKLVMRVSER